MTLIQAKLTLKKYKKSMVYFKKFSIFTHNFERNKVFNLLKCQNYTIGNFTNM